MMKKGVFVLGIEQNAVKLLDFVLRLKLYSSSNKDSFFIDWAVTRYIHSPDPFLTTTVIGGIRLLMQDFRASFQVQSRRGVGDIEMRGFKMNK